MLMQSHSHPDGKQVISGSDDWHNQSPGIWKPDRRRLPSLVMGNSVIAVAVTLMAST
jgi:hypothetical protein